MKKKYYIIILFLVIFVVVLFLVTQKELKRQANESAVSADLISQYREQLSDLKKTADKSGTANDLQNYGIAQYAIGDLQGAIITYQKQIAVDPNNYFAHSGLANALRDEKKFEQAILEYKKVNELAPSYIAGYVNLASVYQYSLNQPDQAMAVYKEGILKNLSSVDLHLLLGMAYEQANDKNNAQETYKKVIEIDENNLVAKTALERIIQE